MERQTDFLALASARYSVRKFDGRPVARETLDRILQAGYVAPTACNRQPQRILVITDEEGLAKLKKCTKSHFNAPAALLICYDKEACWRREYDGKLSGEIDASIVTTHMMLEAYSLGVGSTWVMHFVPEAVRTEFALPGRYEPVALLPLGYPAADAAPFPGHTEFVPLERTVSYGHF